MLFYTTSIIPFFHLVTMTGERSSWNKPSCFSWAHQETSFSEGVCGFRASCLSPSQVGAVNDTEGSAAKRGRWGGNPRRPSKDPALRILSDLIQWKWGPRLTRMAAGDRNWTEDRWNLLCNVAYHFHLTYHQEKFPALEYIVHMQLFIQVLLFIHPFIHFLFLVANPSTYF